MLKVCYVKCINCGKEERVGRDGGLPDVPIRERSPWFDLGDKTVCSHTCFLSYVKRVYEQEESRLARCREQNLMRA